MIKKYRIALGCGADICDCVNSLAKDVEFLINDEKLTPYGSMSFQFLTSHEDENEDAGHWVATQPMVNSID